MDLFVGAQIVGARFDAATREFVVDFDNEISLLVTPADEDEYTIRLDKDYLSIAGNGVLKRERPKHGSDEPTSNEADDDETLAEST